MRTINDTVVSLSDYVSWADNKPYLRDLTFEFCTVVGPVILWGGPAGLTFDRCQLQWGKPLSGFLQPLTDSFVGGIIAENVTFRSCRVEHVGLVVKSEAEAAKVLYGLSGWNLT